MSDAAVTETWRVRANGREIMAVPRIAFLRSVLLNHGYHHRGELSVNQRLHHVPLPSINAPSADENPFVQPPPVGIRMTGGEIAGIAPLLVVRHVPTALAFYRDQLGFAVTFSGPTPDDVFFGIVQRGGAMLMLKDIGVEPLPNYTRDIGKGWAPWDAYLHVPDPDALCAEFVGRGVTLWRPLGDNDDGLRGFEVQDADGYVLYFGRPR